MRRRGQNLILMLGSLAVSLVLGELTLRSIYPELSGSYENFDRQGLPEADLSDFLREIREQNPDLVVIGDSFVNTGATEGGWIQDLQSSGNLTISRFALDGGAPHHYFSAYDRVRAVAPELPVLVLLYIGNDLVDESILQSTAPHYQRFFELRDEVYSDGAHQPYYPCFEPNAGDDVPLPARTVHFLQKRLITFKLATLAFYRVKGFASSFWLEVGRHPTEDMAAEQCYRPPHSVLVKDRLFFFELHDFSVDPDSVANKQSASRIRQYLAERASDRNLLVAVALSREEVCEAFHHVPVKHAHKLISEFAETGVRVLDPNPPFSAQCSSQKLYLPDGHWSYAGHKLFAEFIKANWAPIMSGSSR